MFWLRNLNANMASPRGLTNMSLLSTFCKSMSKLFDVPMLFKDMMESSLKMLKLECSLNCTLFAQLMTRKKKKEKNWAHLTRDFQDQTVDFVGCSHKDNYVRGLIAIYTQMYFGQNKRATEVNAFGVAIQLANTRMLNEFKSVSDCAPLIQIVDRLNINTVHHFENKRSKLHLPKNNSVVIVEFVT